MTNAKSGVVPPSYFIGRGDLKFAWAAWDDWNRTPHEEWARNGGCVRQFAIERALDIWNRRNIASLFES